tara:strand:+ start:31831 stop:32238 length:408 start_codon:yes stop_codon:yes gene_type:complete
MECPICYDKITDDNKEKLKCGHTFHHDCILLSFKNNTQYNGSRIRECPYCRVKSDYLVLREGIIPIKNIHEEYKELKGKSIKVETLDKYLIKNKCNAILMTGVNKGQQCQKPIKEGCFCKTHTNFNNKKYIYFHS